MKCRNPLCQKEAAPGQGYCSRVHAPYAYLDKPGTEEKKRNLKSEKTVRSFTAGAGEASQASSESSKTDHSTLLDTTKTTQKSPQSIESEPRPEKKEQPPFVSFEDLSFEPRKEKTPGSIELDRVHPLRSIEPLKDSDEVTSGSMGTLNESIELSKSLMIAVVEAAKKEKEIDPKKVRAAMECGRNIANMLRLKLDVYKEGRKR